MSSGQPEEARPTTVQRHVLRAGFFRQHSSRVAFSPLPEEGSPPSPEPVRRPAKVAQLLALAHHLQRAIDAGDVHDRATVARRLGFTRARVSQLLDLCLLAPDLQERVLELDAVDGAEPMSERALRAVVHAGSWVMQREAWAALRSDQAVLGVHCAVRPCRGVSQVPAPNPIEFAGIEELNGARTVESRKETDAPSVPCIQPRESCYSSRSRHAPL